MTRTPDLNAAGSRNAGTSREATPAGRGQAGRLTPVRSGLLLIPLLVAVVPVLSACDATIGLYRDITGSSKNDPGPDEPNSDALAAGGSQSFPNLASVPPAPKPALTADQRDRLARGLVADRTNAVHIDQQIRIGTDIYPAAPGPAPKMGPVLEAATLPPVGPGGAPATAVTPGNAPPPPTAAPPPQAAGPSTYVSPLGSTEIVPAMAAAPPPIRAARPAAPFPQSLPDLPSPAALPAPAAPPAAPSPEMAWAAPSVTMMPGQRASTPADAPPADASAADTASDTTTVATIPAQPGTIVAAAPPSAEAPPPPRRETDLLSPDVRGRPGVEVPQPPPGPPVLPPTPENAPVPIPAAGRVASAPLSPGLSQGATPGSPPPEVAPGGALSKLPGSTSSILLGQLDATSVDKKLVTDVAQLQREHSATIRLIGHAARGQGAEAANQQLTGYQAALGRANTIASALTDAGVPANKIVVEAAPVRAGAPAGDAVNRTDVYAEY